MRRRLVGLVTASAVAFGLGAASANALEQRPGSGFLVISHRGASVYSFEETANAYFRAADLGADLLEGDLVMAKDGTLVLCHDIELSRVTNVANLPLFASHKSIRTFNGVNYEGWWIDDFTWPELQMLSTPDGQKLISFDDLVNIGAARGRNLYVEVKDSDYFTSRGLDLTGKVIERLTARGLTGRDTGPWLQSDNPADLQRLRAAVGNRLVFLTREVGEADVAKFSGFRAFADVLGVPTTRVRRSLVEQAHAADLGVHLWTLRGSRDAYRKAAVLGADGVITDFPDLGVNVLGKAQAGPAPAGLTTSVTNGQMTASWTPVAAGAWYAVTLNFGDPLLAPTFWTQATSVTAPMGEAKTMKVTVSAFDGTRLGNDAIRYAAVAPEAYQNPTIETRTVDVRLETRPDATTVVRGRFESFNAKKGKWVPLRSARGWLEARSEDLPVLRRWVTSDRKGEFAAAVRVRADAISGYSPTRSFRVGVAQTDRLAPSNSAWAKSVAGPLPQGSGSAKVKSLPRQEMTFRDLKK